MSLFIKALFLLTWGEPERWPHVTVSGTAVNSDEDLRSSTSMTSYILSWGRLSQHDLKSRSIPPAGGKSPRGVMFLSCSLSYPLLFFPSLFFSFLSFPSLSFPSLPFPFLPCQNFQNSWFKSQFITCEVFACRGQCEPEDPDGRAEATALVVAVVVVV